MRQEPSVGVRRAARVRSGALGFGLGVLSLIVATALGCGGGDSGIANAKLPDGVRSQTIEHEACTESGHKVETVDVNNDGKPDIRRVYAGTQEVCRISDLNRDGKPDMFEYYDKTGQLRRREADYDDNGIVIRSRSTKAGSSFARSSTRRTRARSTRGTRSTPPPESA